MKNREGTLVSIYNWIKDIPFEARLGNEGYHKELAYIKKYKRGACSAKHYFLGSIYERLGITIKYLTFPFYWKDLDITWPEFIKKIAEKMPLQYHLALEISTDGQSFFLDATWDYPLEKVGFPVNKMGNKLTNTKNAIVPWGEGMVHQSALERNEYIKKLMATMISTGVEEKFYTLLNRWLEEIRKT